MLAANNTNAKEASALLAAATDPGQTHEEKERLLLMAQVCATLAVAEELYSLQVMGVKNRQ